VTAREDVFERFQRETANHVMTVKHDDGLYRHLRFESPDKKGDWFSLTTWPQKLVINGSVGTYVFSRQEDMFDLVRQSCTTGVPNFSYWEEKIVAAGDPAIDYSMDVFDEQVAEHLNESEKDYPGVTAAWNEKVNGIFPEYDTSNEHGARFALHDFTYRPDDAPLSDEPFQFYDTGEWDFRDYDWKYLWSCHAIKWGITQYDAAKAAKAEPRAVRADA
jgi:hypothetical protein